MSEDLPLPVRPQTPIFAPGEMVSETSLMIGSSVLEVVSLELNRGMMEVLLVASSDVVEFDRARLRPLWWWHQIFLRKVLRDGIGGKDLDPGNSSDVGFESGPESDQELDAHAEGDDVVEGDTDISSAQGPSQLDDEDNEKNSDSGHDNIKNEGEPTLNCKEEVEWPLRPVQKLTVLLLQVLLPAKGADSCKTIDALDKLRVQRRLGLEIHETKLARGAEVELLDGIESSNDNGEADSGILGGNSDESHLSDTKDKGSEGVQRSNRKLHIDELEILREAVEGDASIGGSEEGQGRLQDSGQEDIVELLARPGHHGDDHLPAADDEANESETTEHRVDAEIVAKTLIGLLGVGTCPPFHPDVYQIVSDGAGDEALGTYSGTIGRR